MAAQSQKAAASGAKPSLHLTRRFRHSPQRLFRAWTDEKDFAQWMGPTGFTVPSCAIDARKGGAWRCTMRSPDGKEYRAHGIVRVFDPPARLVLSWIWAQGEMEGLETALTVEFKPDGDGTELHLIHEGFPSVAQRDDHTKGWNGCLDGLEEFERAL